jgi:hypothetical protein
MYRVQVRGRYRRFETLEAARQFCNGYFDSSGVVLGIEEIAARPVRRPKLLSPETAAARPFILDEPCED